MQGADKRRLRRASNTPPEAASEGFDTCLEQASYAAKGIFIVNQGYPNIQGPWIAGHGPSYSA